VREGTERIGCLEKRLDEGVAQRATEPERRSEEPACDGAVRRWGCGFGWGIYARPEHLVKESIHLGGSCDAPVTEPPVQQGEEGAGGGVG
jgi:hypothetical protein